VDKALTFRLFCIILDMAKRRDQGGLSWFFFFGKSSHGERSFPLLITKMRLKAGAFPFVPLCLCFPGRLGVTGDSARIVEAYIGEYASGKSEVAINRALDLAREGRPVTLVDLDIVEPCYTLRPLKKTLAARGIAVLAWETRQVGGLGETGNILRAENRWALKRAGDVVLDVGYGVEGVKTLNLLEGVGTDPDLRVLLVINIARPMTGSVEDILVYIKQVGRVDGLINNTHLGDETSVEVIQQGARVLAEVARLSGIPVVATTAVRGLAALIGPKDCRGHPVRAIDRYMPGAFW